MMYTHHEAYKAGNFRRFYYFKKAKILELRDIDFI